MTNAHYRRLARRSTGWRRRSLAGMFTSHAPEHSFRKHPLFHATTRRWARHDL